jgi:MFS superfamily sulfate permease-like transporter
MTRSVPAVAGRTDARVASPERAPLRFDWHELAGSLGDLGTFLPLATALAVVAGLDLGVIFIFAGIMHIASGWLFRQPVPVQPMKAIAAVAIAEGLGAHELAAAGILTGALVLTLALCGVVDLVTRYVPKAVVRGIQAGIGGKLALKAIAWLTGVNVINWTWDDALPWLGWDSLLVATLAIALLLWPRARRWPMLLVIFVTGLGLAALSAPAALSQVRHQPPAFDLVTPNVEAWWTGLWRGALPQLPLTLLNSVVAVCALSGDLFPGRALPPRRVAISVGMMNVLAVPFGGMPMCHGSGGLAGQYRFGARTGGSVIMLGAMKIGAGLVLGAGLIGLLQAYPRSILAVMLLFAGLALAKPARDSLHGMAGGTVLVTLIGIVAANTAVGCVAGLIVFGGWTVIGRTRRKTDNDQREWLVHGGETADDR